MGTDEAVEQGRTAHDERRWADAHRLLAAAPDEALSSDDLE